MELRRYIKRSEFYGSKHLTLHPHNAVAIFLALSKWASMCSIYCYGSIYFNSVNPFFSTVVLHVTPSGSIRWKRIGNDCPCRTLSTFSPDSTGYMWSVHTEIWIIIKYIISFLESPGVILIVWGHCPFSFAFTFSNFSSSSLSTQDLSFVI